MKRYLFYLILIFANGNYLYSQFSDQIFKDYSEVKGVDIFGSDFYKNVGGKYSPNLSCKASIIGEKPDGTEYQIVFLVDYFKHKIIYSDLKDVSNPWTKEYGSYGENNGELIFPRGMDADKFGNVYIADSGNDRIVKCLYDFDACSLVYVQNINSNFNNLYDVTINYNNSIENPFDDKIWVADYGNNRIVELTNSGAFIREFGSTGNGVLQFNGPSAIKIYEIVDDNIQYILVGDSKNYRLVSFITDGTWYETLLTTNDEIVDIEIYDEEIYILEKYSGMAHKVRWPNTYLAQFNGQKHLDDEKFYYPNGFCIPFPETPYLCVSEQWDQSTGFITSTQGVDIMDLASDVNINGTNAIIDYRLPTNSIISEKIYNESGEIVKILSEDIILNSTPNVTSTWFCDDENGDQVPGGTYYYQSIIKTKWNFENQPLNKIFNKTNANDFGDSKTENLRLDIPLSTTIVPAAFTGFDQTLRNTIEWGETREDTTYTQRTIGVGYYYDYVHRITRPVFKFDLTQSGLTKRDLIEEASLMLLTQSIYNNEGYTKISVYKILTRWEQGECCWNHPYVDGPEWNGADPSTPYVDSEPVDCIYRNQQTGWYEWAGEGMKELVQDWLENPATNYGIVLKIDDDSGYKDWQRSFNFYSNDPDPVWYDYKMPRIEVVYKKNANIPEFKAEIVTDIKKGTVPFTIKFDASNSFSPSGIKSYSWDLDTQSENTNEDTTGIFFEYTFTRPAQNRLITLTITDSA